MGPTASGKTERAVQLVREFPLDIVSVDSALVYRGMNIGTAKPDAETLRVAPHRLIDIREPEDAYSAGSFVADATREIRRILSAGRTPLLVGGTMLYFRSLLNGIARLPKADPAVRKAIDVEAGERGWPAMHAELAGIDPDSAARIEPRDRQRIQRALEVYRLSARPLSDWQRLTPGVVAPFRFLKLALIDDDRSRLHARINRRFSSMLDRGFIDEVRGLMCRPDLREDSPSMRSVGYRQLWAHLRGDYDLDDATSRAQAATRQLAKRQLTWLRSETELTVFDPLEKQTGAAISLAVSDELNN